MAEDNVTYIKPEFALFNHTVRQNLATSLKGSVPADSEMKTVDRFEEILSAEILKFFRSVFVTLASRAGKALGTKIVGV